MDTLGDLGFKDCPGCQNLRARLEVAERERHEAREAFKDTSDQADDFAAKLDEARRLLERVVRDGALFGYVNDQIRAFLGG